MYATVASVQDSSRYRAEDHSGGINLSVPLGGAGGFGGSINVGKTDLKSDYQSVQEQSGLKAGDDGFQVTVKGNTDLTGAVIASTDAAVTEGKNSLTTGTLTTRDLENKAEYSGSSLSLGGGYSTSGGDKGTSGVGKDQQGKATTGADQTPGSGLPSLDGLSATPPIALSASGEAISTTKSGISGGTITITDAAGQQKKTGQTADEAVASLNRDVASDKDGANALDTIFNEDEIRTRFEIAGAFAREAGTFLENRAKETAAAEQALKEEMKKPESERDYGKIDALVKDIESNETWGMGGTGRLVLTALTGAVGGNVMGSTGSMAQAAAVNVLQGLGAQQVKQLADSLDSEIARTALHGLLACGGAAAKGADCGSAAMGASASVVLNNLIESLDGKKAAGLTEAERDARANLVGNLITGIAAGTGLDASTAGTAAKIETENNAANAVIRTITRAPKILSKLDKLRQENGELSAADIANVLSEEGVVISAEAELLLSNKLSPRAREILALDLLLGGVENYDKVFGGNLAAQRDAILAENGGHVIVDPIPDEQGPIVHVNPDQSKDSPPTIIPGSTVNEETPPVYVTPDQSGDLPLSTIVDNISDKVDDGNIVYNVDHSNPITDPKIRGQMGQRGWTDQDVENLVAKGPSGTSMDNRSGAKTPDGIKRNDTATVYGSPDDYVIINDRTNEIIQVSDKNDPSWVDDGRINWNLKP